MKFIFTILLTAAVNYSISQEIYTPKVINTTKEYIHSTGFKFPNEIKEFTRQTITSFDSSDLNIGITYINESPIGRTKFTVYIYPDKYAHENRLRLAYLEALKSMVSVNKSNNEPIQNLYSYESDGYKIKGLKAEIYNDNNSEYNYLAVFECGKWIMKFRITSDFKDTIVLNQIQKELLQLFNPTDLVKKYPFNPIPQLVLLDKSINDEALLRCIMLAGLTKAGWVQNRVDSLERCSGFPGLYLEEHTGPLQMMVLVWKRSKDLRRRKEFIKESTDRFMVELKSIINKGFLDEFVMDQYNMLLFPPPGLVLDHDKYKSWKIRNPISINLHQPYYIIKYKD